MSHPTPDEAPPRVPSTDELLAVARMVQALAERTGTRVALVGGLALQRLGSPRLTKDVDMVADQLPPDATLLTPIRSLTFGGCAFTTPQGIVVDLIVRDDDYRPLYEDALDRSIENPDGIRVARPEHLAVMKLVTLRPRDYEDLMFLLSLPEVAADAGSIAYNFAGGRFAADQLRAAAEEARWRADRDA